MNDRTKDYVFLSYSHKDDIKELVRQFDEHGYNLVYDEAMSYGEEWDLNARRYISSEKCKGVIFFISEHSLISKPILTEVEYTQKFRKKFFCVLAGKLSALEIKHALYSTLSEDKQYILDSIIENFPPDQLYVSLTQPGWDKICTTFAGWGLASDLQAGDLIQTPYSSDLKGEKSRLLSQSRGYYAFDRSAIDLALGELPQRELVVLDMGCSNGALTISRFADLDRVKLVIGVDYNQRDIDEATASAQAYGGKFVFFRVNLEDEDIIEQLRAIMQQCGVPSIDVVFSALVLHHLKRPSILLLKLYEIMSEDSRIILRGSDDGGKLCYPASDLLQEILDRYSKLVTSSDRSNGRKLYGQLYNAGYTNIRMLYSVTDTCEKDRRSRENLFEVGFSFRLHRIEELIRSNPENAELAKEREWFANALQRLKTAFCDRSFWYCNTSYIAIAGIK